MNPTDNPAPTDGDAPDEGKAAKTEEAAPVPAAEKKSVELPEGFEEK